MNREKYNTKILADLLRERSIATMDEMKRALDTETNLTVTRKLKELGYLTSYSHRGSFYTLEELAKFDENGLWTFGPACFSKHGTLLATAENFVKESDAGCYSTELERLLQVGVKETLLRLFQKEHISRERLFGRYLYIDVEPANKKRQLMTRRAAESEPVRGRLPAGEIHDELKAAIILFFCLLDEQQRRLFAGLEALKWGHGGDRKVADLLSVDVATVASGRRQLLAQDVEVERARKTGGGRKPVVKKTRKSSRE